LSLLHKLYVFSLYLFLALSNVGCFLDSRLYNLEQSGSSIAQAPSSPDSGQPETVITRNLSFALQAGLAAKDIASAIGFDITGLQSSDTIKLFTDSLCATPFVGSDVSSGATVENVNAVVSANQTYQFYYQVTDANARTTNCAAANISYTKIKGITVTTTLTPNATDTNLADGICDNGSGQCTLRAAITQAISNAEETIIDVPAGTYTFTSTISVSVATVVKPLTIRGSTGAIFSGGGTQSPLQIFGSMPSDGALTIKNITFQDGYQSSDYGGGIKISNFAGDLLIESCIFKNNKANERGGGLYIWGVGVVVRNSKFEGNTIDNNGYYGLAIYIHNSATVLLDGIEVKNHNSNPTFVDGVVVIEFSAGVSLVNSAIFNNSHTQDALTFYGCDMCELFNSTIANNSGRGAGISYSTGEMFFISHVTLADNYLSNTGNASRNLNIFHDGGYISLNNSILYTSAGAGTSLDILGAGTRVTNNNIINDNSHGLGGGATNVNPQLSAIADNGGPTWTMLLGIASPARDSGSMTYCQAKDQRGVTRPRDGGSGTPACDIGAVEM
jgi:hypothetical protein